MSKTLSRPKHPLWDYKTLLVHYSEHPIYFHGPGKNMAAEVRDQEVRR